MLPLALSALVVVLAAALVGLVRRLQRAGAEASDAERRLESVNAALGAAASARAAATALPLVEPAGPDLSLSDAPDAGPTDRRPDGRRRTRGPRPLHAVPPVRRDP